MKSASRPLQQIRNRYFQLISLERPVDVDENGIFPGDKYTPTDDVKFRVAEYENFEFFRNVSLGGKFILKINGIRDSFCCVGDDEFIKIFYIARDKSNGNIHLVGKKFQ